MAMVRIQTQQAVMACLVVSVLILAAVIYMPGLYSPFLLDDFNNLKNLDQVSENGYLSYVFSSGIAGPTGRPLSLLTFAIQHDNWPGSPAAFKQVNLLLHLFIGTLVYILTWQLSAFIAPGKPRRYQLALLTTTLWLLHPIQVSTTLYSVQRMTQLSAMFVLLGLISYLHFRPAMVAGRGLPRYMIPSILFCMFTLLASLAKENGILLPLFILVIEVTLLPASMGHPGLRKWQSVFLGLPLAAIGLYLALTFGDIYRSFDTRDYSLVQKMLTEGRVLTDYLTNLFLPRPSSFGLYHDDYTVSTGLFSPAGTLVSVLILIGISVIALLKRKTFHVFSFAVLWFLGGHVLESTFLNLELYFEHRNYLPSYGVFLLLAMVVLKVADRVKVKPIVLGFAGIYCLLVAAMTYMEVGIWANNAERTYEWSRRHPESRRALYDLMQFQLANGDNSSASDTLSRLEQLERGSVIPFLLRLDLQACHLGVMVTGNEWQANSALAASFDRGKEGISILDNLVLKVLDNSCPMLDPDNLAEFIQELQARQAFPGFDDYLYELLSMLSLKAGDTREALEYLDESLRIRFTVQRKLQEVQILEEIGATGQAAAARIELHDRIRNDYRLQLGYGNIIDTTNQL